MAMAALSPNSVLASPIQVNPQVWSDLQNSSPQIAEDAQKTAKAAQTDTITISAQALKMADNKNISAERASDKAARQKEQLAKDRTDNAKSETQRNAVKAYGALSTNQ